MKKIVLLFLLVISAIIFISPFDKSKLYDDSAIVSFYEVPLVCNAAPEIGCGSRVKPLFMDTEKINQIQESWLNREGTVISFVWNENMSDEDEREKIVQPLFDKHSIEAALIKDENRINELLTSLEEKGKWYKGMDVDHLSIEESKIIAESFVLHAKEANILSDEEAEVLKAAIESYFKEELVKVRTYENLKSEETQNKWFSDLYVITENKVGKEKADKIVELFYEKSGEKGCCDKSKNGNSCCTTK